jgi:4-hydroxybenzoate polyprenyltransferase
MENGWMTKHMNGKRMNIRDLWQLIRGGNLLFIALTQILFRYKVIDEFLLQHGVFYSQNAAYTADIMFLMIVMSTVFIAAAGYIINDVYDVQSDQINKPDKVLIGKVISKKSALTVYHSLNIIGLLLSLVAFYVLGKPSLITAPLLVSMMLYLYAIKHKCNGLLGNIFVAFSTALVVLLIWLFEYYRLIIGGANYLLDDPGFRTILIGYSIFAFGFTLLREWAKDLEDAEGDRSAGCRHFMSKRSTKGSRNWMLGGTLVMVVFLSIFQYFLMQNFPAHNLFNAIFITLSLLLLIYVIPLIIRAKEKSNYGKLSATYKLVMAAGILYMLLI